MSDNSQSITLYKAKIIGLLSEALALMDVELRLVEKDSGICGDEHRDLARFIWADRHGTLLELIDGIEDGRS